MIKSIVKRLLPVNVRQSIRDIEKRFTYFFRRLSIKLPVVRSQSMKIIIGAAMSSQRGWFSTNEQWLDITSEMDWERVFKGKSLLSNVLAEHVFEHLTEDEAGKALQLISKHMIFGGKIRVAVPDGYNPDPFYIKHVNIGGIGADAADHKQLLNSDSLTRILQESGFSTNLLEGYLASGELIQREVDSGSGRVTRSRSNASNMASKLGWEFTDANTSLIVDGIKS